MKRLFLLIACAAICTAQNSPTSPVIVKRLSLEGQTIALGSPQSPVELFTPNADGFYRMTVFIQAQGSGPSATICGANTASTSSNCASTGNELPNSIVFAFTVKAGQPIGYYTTVEDHMGIPYNFFIVLEQLN